MLMAQSNVAINRTTGDRAIDKTMDIVQNQKWLKMCVMANSMTEDEARSVPIIGESDIMR